MIRLKIGYETGKVRWIALLLIVITVLSVGLMALVNEPGFGLFFVGFALFMAAICLVFGISPLLTKHEVHETFIVLRQGWYYANRIELTDIVSVSLVRNGPLALGVHFVDGRTTVVNGRTKDLIMMELRPVKHHNGKSRRMTRVLFDTVDNDGFMRAIFKNYDQVLDVYR